MTISYPTVGFNRQKRLYDAVMLACIALYLIAFITAGKALFSSENEPSLPTLLIRAFGTCAFIMLHVVLWIGPLCRLDKRFLPLLYNRRHLGVTTFLIALIHALLSLVIYHGFGNVNPFTSLLTANTAFDSISRFPFELLGLAALAILFLMAATSHDFWLKNLTPRVWKWLHMLVYLAYALLVMHIALGLLQQETSPIYTVLLCSGAAITITLHLIAGGREVIRDRGSRTTSTPRRLDGSTPPSSGASTPGRLDAFIDACAVSEIADARAVVVCPRNAERIAIFRHENTLSAVSNICEHQQGPLGEGKIVSGCITCPWHGYQYLPGTGCSPPPFTEKISTYRVTIRNGRVLLDPRPLPPGTPIEPARIAGVQP